MTTNCPSTGCGSRGGSSALPAEYLSPGSATQTWGAAWSGLLWQKSPPSRACSRSLLYGQVGGPLRPRETGERFDEQVSEPEDTAAIDTMDVAEVLDGWWWGPEEDELAEDEELRE